MGRRPDVAALRLQGEARRIRGDAAGAEPLLREALSRAELDPGAGRRALVASLNALGLLCKDLARFDEAHAHYERALNLLEPHADSDELRHDVATLYHNLAGVEHARGDYVAGEALARRGIDLRRGRRDPDSVALAADLVALAAILDGQRRFAEAEPLYRDALEILERMPDHHGWELAVAHNDLGASLAERGDRVGAVAHLSRALEAKRRVIGARHPDVAVTLNNLAVVQRRAGQWQRAAESYREALDIFSNALGSLHPKTVACRTNYERCIRMTRALHRHPDRRAQR